MDALYSLFADHGPGALTWGLLFLGGLAARHLLPHIGWKYAQDVISRALNEIAFAVREVAQVYADAIKEDPNRNGKLDPEEKERAKQMAIAAAKRNLGAAGLKRLGRVLGLDDVTDWIAGHTEAAVSMLPKKNPALPPAA